MRKSIFVFILLFAVLGQTGASGTSEKTGAKQETKEITAFIAASTTDMIQEISDLFFKKTGIPVKTNPASSGTLAHQIEQGAEPDIYISAARNWMDYVEKLGVLSERAPFIINKLVLIAPSDTKLTPFNLTKDTNFAALFKGRLSMGDPAHVPAGKYGQEALKYFGWYEQITDRLQLAMDVRAALLVVEMGEAELGIVYETDARKSRKVVVLSRFPGESHTPVEYHCALLKSSNSLGKLFYDFLCTDKDVQKLYIKEGFSPAE